MNQERDQHNQNREILKVKKYRDFLREEKLEKPDWIKIKVRADNRNLKDVKKLLCNSKLHTVCEQANCPNLGECFNKKRATFLIMGNICTRRCPYCDVAHGYPKPLDPEEPHKLAETALELGLDYVVLTSVDRDDLKDGGAGHFAVCVRELRKSGVGIEILVPDFRGRVEKAIEKLSAFPPDVFNHNIETVPRLYKEARPGGNYLHSLNLLSSFKNAVPNVPTKTGIMVGLGETDEEIYAVMEDLRTHGVSMLTIGQYLAPSKFHIPVKRYVHPEIFKKYTEKAKELGFLSCLSGPFVRSSYGAREQSFEVIDLRERVQKHL